MFCTEIGAEERSSLLSSLTSRLGDRIGRSFVESVPLACRIMGANFDEIMPDWYACDELVFVFFENNRMMVSARWRDAFDFFSNRAPWQDFDACIFDPAFNRCIAITHNDQIKRVDLR